MKTDSVNAIKIQAHTQLSRYAHNKVFCIKILLLWIRNSEEFSIVHRDGCRPTFAISYYPVRAS
jgi:hypothetical protein